MLLDSVSEMTTRRAHTTGFSSASAPVSLRQNLTWYPQERQKRARDGIPVPALSSERAKPPSVRCYGKELAPWSLQPL